MELAVHLRNIEQAEGIGRLRENLASLYGGASSLGTEWTEEAAGAYDRIYVGDEFCQARLPSASEVDTLLDFARRDRKEITFLTPPLTDSGIEKCVPLLDRLKGACPEAEVVANDLGMLAFLREEYPEFRLAAGRLLDRGFKDPRVPDPEALRSQSAEMKAVLNRSSFDDAAFREMLVEMGVVRLERDLFPYRRSLPDAVPKLKTSIYFPFGYVTTGRVCWTSSFTGGENGRFVPLDKCSRPCGDISMTLGHSDAKFPLFMNGATVYYQHAPEALDSIAEAAGRGDMRLVYQGFAL